MDPVNKPHMPFHWAAISWNGIEELSDHTFCEVVSARSEVSVRDLAHLWAEVNLWCPKTGHNDKECFNYKIQYLGQTSLPDQREYDTRQRVPVNQSSPQHEED